MYGKIFEDIFDSSLMAQGGWIATYVFMSMISMADKDGYVRKDPRTLYRKLGLSEDDRVSFDEFMDSIDELEKEDDLSNLPTAKGKRIIPLCELPSIEGERGWHIVNYLHYRDKGGSLEQRRANDAERKRRQRDKEASECHVTVTPCPVKSAHTDTDTDTDTKEKTKAKKNGRFHPPTITEIDEYALEIKANIDGNNFIDYYQARGWKLSGGNPMKDWKAAVRTWKRNGFNKQQKVTNLDGYAL